MPWPKRPLNVCVLGSGALDGVRGGARSNGYSVTVSAESHGLVIERVFHHRVVLGVLRDAQTPAYRPHTSTYQRVDPRMCARSDAPDGARRAGARSNGYSVMVSVESPTTVHIHFLGTGC